MTTSVRKIIRTREIISFFFIFLIVLLNLLAVYPLFHGGYSANLGSFEAAVLSDARFISHFFPHLSWNPLWYMGYPFYLFYTPLLPAIISLGHLLSNLDFSTIYRLLVGLAYILTPVTLYLLVKYLTRKELPSLLSALAFSTPTATALLFPSVRAFITDNGFVPWRLAILTIDGSGPHIIALFFVPLACLFFLHTLKHPAVKYYILTAIFTGLVFLTHWLAAIALTLMFLVILFSEIVLGETFRKIKSAFFCGLLTYGLIAFWFNPDFIVRSLFFGENSQAIAELLHLTPLGFVIVPVAVTVLFLAFDRKPKLQIILIAGLWFAVFFSIIAAFNYWGKTIMPSPDRYVPEMAMTAAVLLGVLLTYLMAFLRKLSRLKLNLRLFRITTMSLLVALVGVFIWLLSLTLPASQRLTAVHPDIKSTFQYQVAEWLDSHTSGERVYVTGSTSAWLNVWTDVPQVYGWADLGSVNPWWQAASEEIEKGKDGGKAVSWLRATGAAFVAVTGNDFRYPEKFEGLMPVVAKGQGWRIYEVPLKNRTFLQINDKRELEDIQKAGQISDPRIMTKYLEWLDTSYSSREQIQRINNRQIAIDVWLGENDGLVIQESYFRGWQAKIDGEPVGLAAGPMGFIFIDPGEKTGQVKITLDYRLPGTVSFGYILSALVLLAMILLQVGSLRRKAEKWFSALLPKGVLMAPVDSAGLAMAKEDELSKQTKEYYQKSADHRWIEMADNFQGLESYFHRNREALMRKLVQEFGVGEKYLDAGCGDGLVLRHLPPKSVGLDINPRAIALAKQNAPHAALVIADIDEIPFPDNMFDTVLCTEVLEHLPEPQKAMAELLRVLKPGGVLIGTVPRLNPMWHLQFLTTSLPQTMPYHKEYRRQELRRLLSQFELIELKPSLSDMVWVWVARKS